MSPGCSKSDERVVLGSTTAIFLEFRFETTPDLKPATNSRVARDCVVELVGLEPTTRVLWNVGVSDQLTLSDTQALELEQGRY